MGNIKETTIQLPSQLWLTCRAIANETRLRLLWSIFQGDRISVAELSRAVKITEQNASNQLKTLRTQGLVTPYRKKQQVFYKAIPNSNAKYAAEILRVLRRYHDGDTPFKNVIREATALTHPRRIEIIKELGNTSMTQGELVENTGMTTSAMARHLEKLRVRGFVNRSEKLYSIGTPNEFLSRLLIQLIPAR